MRFPELRKLAAEYRQLEGHLMHFDGYLAEVANKPSKLQMIVPAQVAQALGIDEGLALVLLRLADKAGILRPWYYAYCDESNFFLGRFETLEGVPRQIPCPIHELLHDDDQYYLELTFTFSNNAPGETQEAARARVDTAAYMI